MFYRWKLHPLSKFPGPLLCKLTDLYTGYHSWIGDSHITQWKLHEIYGPVIRVGPNKLAFSSPQALQDIYKSARVEKFEGYSAMNQFAGYSNVLTAVNKDEHRRKRKAVNPAFSDQALKAFQPTMLGHINNFLKGLAETENYEGTDGWSKSLNLTDRSKWLTVDVMGSFAFGHLFRNQTDKNARGMINGMKRGTKLYGLYVQWPEIKKLNIERFQNWFKPKDGWTRVRLAMLLRPIIENKLAAGVGSKTDLVSYIMAGGEDEDGKTFTLNELWSESIFFLLAGSDTTAATICGCMFYLSRYPDAYEKLAAEIRGTFAKPEDIQTGPALNGCTYLRAIIDETLRSSPPVGTALWRRITDHHCIVDGNVIPPGTDVGSDLYALFHDERLYPDPHSFVPERMLPQSEEAQKQGSEAKTAFKPFSLGARNCAGQAMALMQISLILAKVMWHYDFRVPNGAERKVGEVGEDHKDEYRLNEHITPIHDGPFLQYKLRAGVGELRGI